MNSNLCTSNPRLCCDDPQSIHSKLTSIPIRWLCSGPFPASPWPMPRAAVCWPLPSSSSHFSCWWSLGWLPGFSSPTGWPVWCRGSVAVSVAVPLDVPTSHTLNWSSDCYHQVQHDFALVCHDRMYLYCVRHTCPHSITIRYDTFCHCYLLSSSSHLYISWIKKLNRKDMHVY